MKSLTGVVLSGGGANGAYEVGVLKALTQGASPVTGYRPLKVDIYSGASVGAYNAAVIVGCSLSDLAAVRHLEDIWRRRLSTSPGDPHPVFRLRGNALNITENLRHPFKSACQFADDMLYYTREFLDRGLIALDLDGLPIYNLGYFIDPAIFLSIEPFAKLIRETVELRGVRSSSKILIVTAADWKSGVAKNFINASFKDPVGHDLVAASSAVPLIAEQIVVDGKPYVDGGVVSNTPSTLPLQFGAGQLHIIVPEARPEFIPFPPRQNVMNTLYRMMQISWDGVLESNSRIERSLDLMRHLRSTLSGNEAACQAIEGIMLEVTRWTGDHDEPIHDLIKNMLTIAPDVHVYRPTKELNVKGGFMNFQKQRISRLIELGYQDAVHHNCEIAGCTLSVDASENSHGGKGL